MLIDKQLPVKIRDVPKIPKTEDDISPIGGTKNPMNTNIHPKTNEATDKTKTNLSFTVRVAHFLSIFQHHLF